jgi:hypothetical protein
LTLAARGFRHHRLLWQDPERRWRWASLVSGESQPKRFVLGRGPWRYRPFRFHLTPIHVERWSGKWEIGVCIGRRTLAVLIHR